MKIMVATKRVVDFNVAIRVRSDGSGVETDGVKMSLNPFDEIALEEAVRLKEAGHATDVLAVSIGGAGVQETLRTALAVGADRAMWIECEETPEPIAVAKLLSTVARNEGISLALLGKQAIDDDAGQTAEMLAALLDWPQASFAASIATDGTSLNVTCETDDGSETLDLDLPAVVSADLRLNEPRFATLPAMMRAKKKEIIHTTAQDLGVNTTPRLETIDVSDPPARAPGVMVASIDELAEHLRQFMDKDGGAS